jgi:hypothetical protein
MPRYRFACFGHTFRNVRLGKRSVVSNRNKQVERRKLAIAADGVMSWGLDRATGPAE